MGYCTETDITKTIAQSLTTATADTPNDFGSYNSLINVGNTFDRNTIPSETVEYYIQLADSEIDGLLSQLYVTPFCEKVDFESTLYSGIDEYNPYIVLERKCPLAAGDVVALVHKTVEERHEIDAIVATATFSTVSEIAYYFPEGTTRVLRLTFPPPLRFISARLAAAAIYDKYFTAESSANVSKFGDALRAIAYDRLNDILGGRIILHGQQRIGRRFYNPNLVDQYGLKNEGDITRNPGR
jgi:hypothetical protein